MSSTDGEDTKQNNYMRSWVKIVVGRLEEHSKTVAGVIVRMDLQNAAETIKDLEAESKQQEEVIRELTDLLQRLIDGEKSFIKQYPRTSKNIESLLEKAKSLTTKDK